MSAATRFVTLWCPEWPVVAARLAPDEPAVVLRAERVIARNPAAIRAGIRPGERRRTAQQACPRLVLVDHDPDRDGREFEPVVRAVAELAPRLEVVEPGLLCLPARGPSRYFGGEQAAAELLVTTVPQAAGLPEGTPIGVGVADGRAPSAIAARLAARREGNVVVVEPGGSPAFVGPLPIQWLRELGEATPELVELFLQLGLRTLGALAALPPSDVLARFGVEGAHAHRLAGGADRRPPVTRDPGQSWVVDHPFDEPVESLDTVVFVVKRLADDLVERLAGEGRVCVRLVVIAETDHGERSERAWYRDHGLSATAIVERARWQLEGWAAQPGALSGGVVLLRLVADEVRSDDGVQGRLWGGRSQADSDASRAIARLTGLAGERAVRVPTWAGGRLPNERYRFVPATSVDLHDPTERLARGEGPWPGATPPPSPAVVPPDPPAVDLIDEGGEPVRVSGRGELSAAPAELVTAGVRRRVVAWAGPWPVEQRWWSPERSRRVARLQLVTEGGVAYQVGVDRQQWAILGVYA